MDPLSVAASVISLLELTTSVISYLNDVKTSSNERQRCLVEASNCLSLLTILRFRIESSNASDPWFVSVRALASPNGPFDQFKEALERLSSKLKPKTGALGRVGGAALWTFSKKEIAYILNRVERLKSHVQLALEDDTFKLAKVIQQDAQETRDGVRKVLEVQQEECNSALLEWLSPVDYATQLVDIRQRREPGTGGWFLEDKNFLMWLHGSDGVELRDEMVVDDAKALDKNTDETRKDKEPEKENEKIDETDKKEDKKPLNRKTLFCPGHPGTGKTVLSSAAVDYLWQNSDGESVGIAFLFCNYKRREEQNVSHFLSSILKQLLQTQPDLPRSILDLHELHSQRRTTPTTSELSDALAKVVGIYDTIYIVVDALDECEGGQATRSHLLTELFKLRDEHDFRILATSRFIPDVVENFQDCPRVEISANANDVRKYLGSQMVRLPRIVQKDMGLQEQIKSRIVEAVEGMFLLARLYLESLLNKRSMAAIKAALAKLVSGPEALSQAYDDALERIAAQPEDDRKLAKSTISWITHAVRPLKIVELQHALAVDDSPDLDGENMLEIEDILAVCAGLVVVNEENEVVALAHYTTQEYFEKVRADWIPNASTELTEVCIRYLTYDGYLRGPLNLKGFRYRSRVEPYQLFQYAAVNWGNHARHGLDECRSASQDEEELIEKLLEFLQGSSHCWIAAEALLNYGNFPVTARDLNIRVFEDEENDNNRAGCHLAAWFGLDKILELLSTRYNVQPNARYLGGMTPLHWAAISDKPWTVKFLLHQPAVDINSKDSLGFSVLAHAIRASGAKMDTVDLLLGHSAQVDEIAFEQALNQGSIPLLDKMSAHMDGPQDALSFFFAILSNPNAKELLAYLCKSDSIAKNWREPHNLRNLLVSAASQSNNFAFDTLIEYAKPEDAIQFGRKTGQLASFMGSVGFNRAFAMDRDPSGRSPISYAMKAGQLSFALELGKTNGVQITPQDVGVALRHGHIDLVCALSDELGIKTLDENATTNTKESTTGDTLPAKVPIDMPDFMGRTPLFYAVRRRGDAAKKLLAKFPQIDVNRADALGLTAVFYAGRKQRYDTERYLIDRHGAVWPGNVGDKVKERLAWFKKDYTVDPATVGFGLDIGDDAGVSDSEEMADAPKVADGLGEVHLGDADNVNINELADPVPDEPAIANVGLEDSNFVEPADSMDVDTPS